MQATALYPRLLFAWRKQNIFFWKENLSLEIRDWFSSIKRWFNPISLDKLYRNTLCKFYNSTLTASGEKTKTLRWNKMNWNTFIWLKRMKCLLGCMKLSVCKFACMLQGHWTHMEMNVLGVHLGFVDTE